MASPSVLFCVSQSTQIKTVSATTTTTDGTPTATEKINPTTEQPLGLIVAAAVGGGVLTLGICAVVLLCRRCTKVLIGVNLYYLW